MVKRSSRLANSAHSWHSAWPAIASTRHDVSSTRRISVPQLERGLQGVALDAGGIGEPHLDGAFAVRRIAGGRLAEVGQCGVYHAGRHLAAQGADDRVAPAVR